MAKLCVVAIALLATLIYAEDDSASFAKWLNRSKRAIAAGSCGQTSVPPFKLELPKSQRVVGGKEAKPRSFPFIVSIQTTYGSHFCGGSLIRTDSAQQTIAVITASHCIADSEEEIYVVAGAHNVEAREPTTQRVRVARKIAHEQYNGDTVNNDIAVLILEKPIKFNDNVQPICLPPAGEEIPAGAGLTVAGWGLMKENGDTSSLLMHATVPSIPSASCGNQYASSGIKITSGMICAGFKTGGYDACQGDSGGPLFTISNSAYTLRGVVSFGIGCARPGMPGVYAKVTNYLPWITAKARVYS